MTSDQAVFINFRQLGCEAQVIKILPSCLGKPVLQVTFLDTARLN
jgi:hypothetical protein